MISGNLLEYSIKNPLRTHVCTRPPGRDPVILQGFNLHYTFSSIVIFNILIADHVSIPKNIPGSICRVIIDAMNPTDVIPTRR